MTRPNLFLTTSLALALGAAGCTGNIGDQPGGPSGMGPGPSTPGGTTPGGTTPGGTTPGGTAPGGTTPGGTTPGGTTQGGTTPGGVAPGGGEVIPAQAGHIPMRRLTRTQYNNTIHDLLGIAGDPAGLFGVDEEEGGFAANNQAPLKELQIEKYGQAAEDLADKAVANLGTLLRCPAGANDAACTKDFIRDFGKRAYRRPLTDEEIARYNALYETGRGGTDHAAGVSLVLAAMLQSPNFLYRVELGDAAATGGTLALTPWEVGTRLSYFLINSTPDEPLLAAAEAGKLKTPEGIAAEAQRLLASPKARQTMNSFYEQWLQVEDLLSVEKDMKAYPVYSDEVRTAMRDEVLEFVDQVTRVGDGKLETLLTSTSSWLRGPLYPVYGLPMPGNAGGSILKQMNHPATERAGIFTLAGVMAKHGHADQSSPVGRGYLITTRLLCVVPAPPPPGADDVIPQADPNVPTRVRFEMHRQKPECAACHALMDPLGVTFEIYDGVGRYRAMDGGKPVDSTSELTGTKASNGPVKNAMDLMKKLSVAEETRACFTKQMFRYAFGRNESDKAGSVDMQIVDAALGAFNKTGRIPDLMVAIATTPGFRTRVPVDAR